MDDSDFAKSIGATPVASSSDADFAKSIGATPVTTKKGDSFWNEYVTQPLKSMEDTDGATFGDYVKGSIAGVGGGLAGGLIDGWRHALGRSDKVSVSDRMTQDLQSLMGGATNNSNAIANNVGGALGLLDPIAGGGIPRFRVSKEHAAELKFNKGEAADKVGPPEPGFDPNRARNNWDETPPQASPEAQDLGATPVPEPTPDWEAIRNQVQGNGIQAGQSPLIADQAGNVMSAQHAQEIYDSMTPNPQGKAPEWPAPQYSSQDELGLTNSPQQVAEMQGARANQGDMFNNAQGPVTPYAPAARLPTDNQEELPLQSSTQQVADHASENAGQLGLFSDSPENPVSTAPMNSVPAIAPQVAMMKAQEALQAAAHAEEAGKNAEAAFWKERAMEMTRQARQAETTPRIDVNDIGTAGTPNQMDALTRSTEGVETNQIPPGGVIPRDSAKAGLTVPRDVNPRWVTDENGMPVRQGMPTDNTTGFGGKVDPNYTTGSMDVSSDTPEANALGNAIQEANGPKLGPDDTYGSGNLFGDTGTPEVPDRAPKTVSEPFNNTINSLQRKQGGFISPGDFVEAAKRIYHATNDLADKLSGILNRMAAYPIDKIASRLPEGYMRQVPGMREALDGLIPKPDPGTTILQRALAEGINNTKLFKSMQSGLIMAGEKYKSSLLSGVGDWLRYSELQSAYRNKTQVKPMEKLFADLPRSEFNDLHQKVKDEVFNRTRLDPSTLSPGQAKAYTKWRQFNDDLWTNLSATREKLGLKPATREEAYAASLRHGDYHQSFYDKDGNLAWHVQSTTMRSARKAEAYLRENHPNDIDWSRNQEATTNPEVGGIGMPKDPISTYHAAMDYFNNMNSPVTDIIKAQIDKYNSEHAANARGMEDRFKNKSNIRGFDGDKPWLSDTENAHAFWKAQMSYAKNGMAWSHFQDAMAELKPILSNEQLIKNQPDFMKMAQMQVAHATGSITGPGELGVKLIESALAHKVGVSRSSLYHLAGDLKTGTMLQMLGLSPGYMITTPLQGILSVAMHAHLSGEGYSHNFLLTISKTVVDSSAALMQHYLGELTGKSIQVPMSDFGRRALNFAEDNGVIQKLQDEYAHLGGSRAMNAVRNTLNPTITTPEVAGRMAVYMSIVHHLADARNGMPETEIFNKAAKLTDLSMTDMKSSARPLVVSKAGALGETAYLFHSYLFNQAHQLHMYWLDAANHKSYAPALAMLGAFMFLGGTMAIPGVNEIDGLWNMTKEILAEHEPAVYAELNKLAPNGIGIKGNMLKDLPTWASQGVVSSVTGAALSSRFGPSFLDPEHPFQGLAAPIQEAKEQGATLRAVTDPTKRNAEQAGWVNAPPMVKGWMETHLDDFKNGQVGPQGQAYRSAANINDPSTTYRRTPQEETMRKFGMTGVDEFATKAIRYANNQEQERAMTAFKSALDKATSAAIDGNTPRAQKFAQAALSIFPDSTKLQEAYSKATVNMALTPEERDKVASSQSIEAFMKLRRVLHANQ